MFSFFLNIAEAGITRGNDVVCDNVPIFETTRPRYMSDPSPLRTLSKGHTLQRAGRAGNTNETIHTDTHEVRECEKAGARMCPTQQKSAKCPRGSTPPLGPGTGPITSHPSPGLSVAAPPTHVTHTHNVSRHVGKSHGLPFVLTMSTICTVRAVVPPRFLARFS